MARRARRWSLGLVVVASGTLLTPKPAAADEVQLRAGGRVSGVIVERTERTITIETGPGRVTLPLSLVEKIVESRSVIDVWQERSSSLRADDLQGWAELARWAEERSLATQAQAAWQRVLTLDPGNAEANAALGRVQLAGAWVAREESYRAQGLMPFEGRWVTRDEYDALVQRQIAESTEARERREAEIRLREAESRAREAEARAREAEGAAAYEGDGGGIPIWDVYGGCAGLECSGRGHGRRGDSHGRHRRDDGNRRDPAPAPTPRPSSIGPRQKDAAPASPKGVPDRSRPRAKAR